VSGRRAEVRDAGGRGGPPGDGRRRPP